MVLFRQGFKLYHRTKFAEAQALFNEVLEADAESKQQHIAEAKELFEEILHVNPHDKVARLYLDRCEQIQKYGVPDEWAAGGVTVKATAFSSFRAPSVNGASAGETRTGAPRFMGTTLLLDSPSTTRPPADRAPARDRQSDKATRR